MVRKLASVMAFSACALVALVALNARQATAQDKKATTKEIMKACTGAKGLCKKTLDAGNAGKWADAKASGAELKAFGTALAANKPKKGSEDSWKTLSAKFADQTAAVAAAADKEDKAALATAAKEFADSCKACHSVHK